jgi:hypothetical protein
VKKSSIYKEVIGGAAAEYPCKGVYGEKENANRFGCDGKR